MLKYESISILQESVAIIATAAPVFADFGWGLGIIGNFLFETLQIIPLSTHIQFFTLIYDAAILFASLNGKIQKILVSNDSAPKIISELENWRQDHVLVCQLVDDINASFGLVLLVSITSYFITLIKKTYELYNLTTTKSDNLPPLGYALYFFVINSVIVIHFILLVILPYRMRLQVCIFTYKLSNSTTQLVVDLYRLWTSLEVFVNTNMNSIAVITFDIK